MNTLAAALRYVSMGWGVVPLHTPDADARCSCGDRTCENIGKHPRLGQGDVAPLWDRPPDADQVHDWWSQWPDANVGVLTGPQSGLVVLDKDPRHGGDASLEELIERHGPLPDGPEVLTGGGGIHRYYQWPGGLDLWTRPILPGLDIRAKRAYVVAPPSMHASKRQYEWESSSEPWDISPPPCPPHIVASFQVAAALSSSVYVVTDEPFDIERVIDTPIPDGLRNLALTQVAGHCYGTGKTLEETLQFLHGVNRRLCDPPLSDREVKATAESVQRTHQRNEHRRMQALRMAIPNVDTKFTPQSRLDHVNTLLALAILDAPAAADWSLSQGEQLEYVLRFRDGRSVSLGPRIGDQTTIRHRLLDGGPLILKPMKSPEWLRWAAAMRALARVEQFEPTESREVLDDWLSEWIDQKSIIDDPDDPRAALNQSVIRVNGTLWLKPVVLYNRLAINGHRRLELSMVYKRLTQTGWRKSAINTEGATRSGRTTISAWRES